MRSLWGVAGVEHVWGCVEGTVFGGVLRAIMSVFDS